MPILYEETDRAMRHYRAKLKKFSASPGFWTGFGVATILFIVAMPILAEPVYMFLKKKAA